MFSLVPAIWLRVVVLAAKPNDLSWVPRTHKIEEENSQG